MLNDVGETKALTTRYLRIGGDLMKASPIRNRPVHTHGNSMKKLTALSLLTLLALVGAPRAWGQAACTGCTTSQSGINAIYTFLGSGSFTPTAGMTVSILVVAGGGGGGGAQASSSSKYNFGGGGGAGDHEDT